MSQPTWRFHNNYMPATDLSNDDDYISHVLLDTVGTETPLGVHHMRIRARMPAHDTKAVMKIIRKRIIRPSNQSAERLCSNATDAFLRLPFVAKHIKRKTPEQIDAFATHAWRYFKLYIPFGCIEIAHTSRYTFRTNKSELCVLAIANIPPGEYLEQLEGSMARLTQEEDAELSRTRKDGYGSRRDFSVVQILGGNRSLLFLGPARFVNHDCEANCELERKDKVMRFRTKRAIKAGEEITAHYADDYFGKNNRECLCETCEKLGRGGWSGAAPESASPDENDPLALTTAPESPVAKRSKVAGRTLQIDSEDSSEGDEGGAAGVRVKKEQIDTDAEGDSGDDDEDDKGKGPRTRRASSNAASTTSHPTVKFPRMRRNLPRGPGGQFRRKKAGDKGKGKGKGKSQASNNGNNGSDQDPDLESESESESEQADNEDNNSDAEEHENGNGLVTRSRRASMGQSNKSGSAAPPSASTSRRKSAPEPPSASASGSSKQAGTGLLAAAEINLGGSASVNGKRTTKTHRKGPRELSRSPSILSTLTSKSRPGRGVAAKAKTPAPESRPTATGRRASTRPVTPVRRTATATSSKANSRSRASSGSSSSSSSDSSDSDDAPKRVLRPRASAAAATAEPSAEISPTAPNVRQMKELMRRTRKYKPQWKGWVSIPSGTCDQCFEVHEELKGLTPTGDEKLICSRCKRHRAIYGTPWPTRVGGIFSDSSTTSNSDDGSSSDSDDEPVRVTRHTKRTRILKRTLQSVAPVDHRKGSTATGKRKEGKGDNRARRAARRQRNTSSVRSGSEVSNLAPPASTSRARGRASGGGGGAISATVRKSTTTTVSAKEKDHEPPNKKRKVIAAGTSNVTTSVTVTVTTRPKAGSGGVGGSGMTQKELERAARAKTRELINANPDRDRDELKVAAAAGVMRSGRARGGVAERMPVTGPPITNLSKRKRAATTDVESGDETHMMTRRGTRITPATATPTPQKSTATGRRKSAAASASKPASKARRRASAPGSGASSKTELRTRSGARWGAPSESEDDDEGADSDKMDEDSPISPRVRRPLLSLAPNPSYFALRKHGLSDPAVPVDLDKDSASTKSTSVAGRKRGKSPFLSITHMSSDISEDAKDDTRRSKASAYSTLSDTASDYLRVGESTKTPRIQVNTTQDDDFMDISSDDAGDDSRAAILSCGVDAAKIVKDNLDDLPDRDMTVDVDVSVDQVELSLVNVEDGASSDKTQASVPSLASSGPSSRSSNSVKTPQTDERSAGVSIRGDTPGSIASTPPSVSKTNNVRTYQTYKRSHIGVSAKTVRPSH